MNDIQLNSVISLVMGENRGIDRKICQARPAKVRAAFRGVDLVKRSTWWCRFVGYEAQKSVQEARENGRQRKANNWLSLTKYCDGLYLDDKGQYKLGIGHSAFKHERSKEWVLNGKVVPFEEIKHMVVASEYTDYGSPDWFTVFVENIVAIDDIEIVIDSFDVDLDETVPAIKQKIAELSMA